MPVKVTSLVSDFIRKKVESKVAKVTLEQDFETAKLAAELFAKDLTEEVNALAKTRFEEFLAKHPELANSTLTNPLDRYHSYHVSYSSSVICKELVELTEMRKEYVDELIQRVCIDASKCKDSEELEAVIDKVCK